MQVELVVALALLDQLPVRLDQLSLRVQPLLLVLTTRPQTKGDPSFAELEAFKAKDGMQPLSELAKPDVDDLMRHMLGVTGRVAVDLSTDIHKRSGGNPFFAKGPREGGNFGLRADV